MLFCSRWTTYLHFEFHPHLKIASFEKKEQDQSDAGPRGKCFFWTVRTARTIRTFIGTATYCRPLAWDEMSYLQEVWGSISPLSPPHCLITSRTCQGMLGARGGGWEVGGWGGHPWQFFVVGGGFGGRGGGLVSRWSPPIGTEGSSQNLLKGADVGTVEMKRRSSLTSSSSCDPFPCSRTGEAEDFYPAGAPTDIWRPCSCMKSLSQCWINTPTITSTCQTICKK